MNHHEMTSLNCPKNKMFPFKFIAEIAVFLRHAQFNLETDLKIGHFLSAT